MKDKYPAISVIMLTFNREAMLSGMTDCILAQTFTDYEFIIVDNGSTDHSGQIADSYAEKDNRIRVIHRERGSIGAGRNTGLDAALGNWIAFVDDDDTCTPDFLEFLYNLAVDNNADISICGATWADIDEKRIMTAEAAIETLLWRKRYNVAFPTKLFKRELFDNQKFPENSKYDDIYLMPVMLSKANKVVYHGLSKYHFNRHGHNNSAWTQDHSLLDAETLREYLKVYNERTEWLCGIFPDRADLWKYFNWSFMISMVEKVNRLSLHGCDTELNAMVKELAEHKAEFTDSPYSQDFEISWFKEFVTA